MTKRKSHHNHQPKPELQHIALLMKNYLKRERITAGEMSERLGRARDWTGIYSWIRGSGAPLAENRIKLAQLLGVSEEELLPEGGSTPQQRAAETKIRNRSNATHVDTLERQLAEVQPARMTIHPKAQDVLGYNVDSDGQATLRLVARGAHAQLGMVFRMLLDAGLVPGGEEEQA